MKYQSLYDFQGEDPADTIAITAPGNLEDMVGYSRLYKERSIRHIFDPGQQLPVLSEENQLEAITGSWMLISNDYELEMIMRTTGLDKGELLQRTEIIITTLGDRGALVSTATEQTHIPAARASRGPGSHGSRRCFSGRSDQGFRHEQKPGGIRSHGCGVLELQRRVSGNPVSPIHSRRILGAVRRKLWSNLVETAVTLTG